MKDKMTKQEFQEEIKDLMRDLGDTDELKEIIADAKDAAVAYNQHDHNVGASVGRIANSVQTILSEVEWLQSYLKGKAEK